MTDERDGIWNYTNIFPVLDALGDVTRVAIFAQDITERKLSEAKLQKSEERYRNLFQHSNDAIFVHTLDGKIIDVNSAACRLLGLEKEKMIGLNVRNLHPKESVPEGAEGIRITQEKGWVRFESKLIRADNSIIEVDIGSRIVEPKTGIVQGIVRDITDQVRAKQALHDSEEKYRGLAERSPNILILIKHGGRPYYVSPSVKDILGFSPEDVLGKLPGDFMSKEDEAKVFSLMGRIQDGVDVDSFEVPMLKKDKTPVTIEWTLIPIHKDGVLDGYQALGRDITEKKVAEEKLRESRKQLRELSKHLQNSREQERAGIAREIHDDLGQSLMAIKMDAAWLKSKIPEDLTLLHNKAEDTIILVDSAIQTVKRISSELRPGLLDDLGLSAAIEWQAADYQKRSGVNIYVTIEPEEIVLEEVFSIVVFRVCQEALTNIVRHSGATDVWVNLTKNSQYLELEVLDNGIGISNKSMTKKNSFGLIGMRERVHAIGGKISISRIQKGGTKVAVKVPLMSAVN
jgi:PAS domain S-box-containing protein